MDEPRVNFKLTFTAPLYPFKLVYTSPNGGTSIDHQIVTALPNLIKVNGTVYDFKNGVNIGQNVILKLSTKENLDQVRSLIGSIRNPEWNYVFSLESTIEGSGPFESFITAWTTINDRINCVLNALRLLQSGTIEANIRLVRNVKNGDTNISFFRESSIPRDTDFQKAYELKNLDINRVKALTEQISAIDFAKRGTLRIAIDRFERSYYEPYLEDQLIDYMIAFEALFIGKKTSDKSSIIPIATAMLLGKNHEERERIIKNLEFAYRIRNYIVHGSDYEKTLEENKVQLNKLTNEVENLLRQSLQRLI